MQGLEQCRAGTVGLVLSQRGAHEPGRVLDLSIGEQVGAFARGDDDSEAQAVLWRELDETRVHTRQMCRAVIGRGRQHAQQQGAHLQLTRAHSQRKPPLDRLDRLFDTGVVEERLEAPSWDHPGCLGQSRPTACSSVGLARFATRSPRRWEQLIPAASMKARRPICAAMADK